ncbi:hypothetical protein ACFQ2M_33245 [Kitasatospora saccharophila]|uniref:hypothetical protein n=1 Tax=Kitasatospora saccharophila TaxID=407973 RepID=UPI00362B8BB6
MTLTTESHPAVLAAITEGCAALGFAMSCDLTTGQLLRTLAAARPGGGSWSWGRAPGRGRAGC